MTDNAQFRDPDRTHVLMITNHGVHEWDVVPGLPDTGGQNVYVNQFTEALVAQGYRVTIVNRGGYPHPTTGEPQTGVRMHPSGRARILYLTDGRDEFVRKEDMAEQIPELAADLDRVLREDDDGYDLIISHYWDAAVLGVELNDRSGRKAPHVWVPHSLGALKKKNMDPSTWENLRIDERIEHERQLIARLDGAVATSTAIRDTFVEDYGYEPKYFLPPCVDTDRYRPRTDEECADIYEFLAEIGPIAADDLRSRLIVTEISRTDHTKRKDILIRAFAQARAVVPEAALAVALDPRAGAAYDEAMALVDELGVADDVIVLGSVWDRLPCIYAATSVYCTPSVMEGFGMSAQEAAATSKPVVSSDLVPYTREYLLGDAPQAVEVAGSSSDIPTLIGEGAIVVPADDVAGFAVALTMLLEDEQRRDEMGARALDITVPYFTWAARTRDLLDDLRLAPTKTT